MGYASRSGRASTDPRNPKAFGVCQRCGQWWNRWRLRNQLDYRGTTLAPLYIFVCEHCYDIPQPQLKAITVPADPVPIEFPLIEPFLADEYNPELVFNDQTGPNNGDRNSQYLGSVI